MQKSNKEFYKFVSLNDYKHLPPQREELNNVSSWQGSVSLLPSAYGNEISFDQKIQIGE